jgi:integrase
MAMQALTVRGIEALKPQAKRFGAAWCRSPASLSERVPSVAFPTILLTPDVPPCNPTGLRTAANATRSSCGACARTRSPGALSADAARHPHVTPRRRQRNRYEVFDTIVPGFAIRVTPAGHKSFTLYYRHHGRLRRVGLGRYPDVLLADARKAATQHRGRIYDGADPAEEKKAERATNGDTVGALFDLYKTHREKAKSWTETRRIMEREVLPVWRHLRVVDLKRRDVRELVERKARFAPVMANRILSRISAMLTFAMEHDWIESNPVWRIRKPGDERSRDRVLTRDELRELWPVLHQTEAKNAQGQPLPRLSQTLNDALVVMQLTAQRRGEVCTMRWQDIDLLTGWWLIPAESSKNADPHRVPLTPMVLKILARREKAENRDDLYVFSNHRHTCVLDRAKKAAAILCKGGVSFQFRAHDLRRTAASYMGEAGVDRFHRARAQSPQCDA